MHRAKCQQQRQQLVGKTSALLFATESPAPAHSAARGAAASTSRASSVLVKAEGFGFQGCGMDAGLGGTAASCWAALRAPVCCRSPATPTLGPHCCAWAPKGWGKVVFPQGGAGQAALLTCSISEWSQNHLVWKRLLKSSSPTVSSTVDTRNSII